MGLEEFKHLFLLMIDSVILKQNFFLCLVLLSLSTFAFPNGAPGCIRYAKHIMGPDIMVPDFTP